MPRVVTEEEKQQVFDTLTEYYRQAAPIIERVSDLNTFKYGELPLNPYMLVEAGITLKMMLHALRKLPEPHDRELAAIRREFDTALSSCIRAAEATEKYVEYTGTSKSRMILNIIINSTVMANEYMSSVSKKLRAYNPACDNIAVIQPHRQTISEKKVTAGGEAGGKPQAPAKKKPGGILPVLDKIGDVIIYPIVKMAELGDAVHKPEDKEK